jgi:hypothetical protein
MATTTNDRAPRTRIRRSGIWEFHREPDGRWRWQRVDDDGSMIAFSAHTFHHLLECLADARADGCTEEQSRFMSWPG